MKRRRALQRLAAGAAATLCAPALAQGNRTILLGQSAALSGPAAVMPYPFSTTTAIAREYLDALRHAGGYTVGFGPRNRRGSSFVEMTMLSEDGKVKR